jgi:hypothetical protein
LFRTGRTPGIPMHTWHVCEFGPWPNLVEHPQNIFDAVFNCACTSSPITGSYCITGIPPVIYIET